MTRTISRLFNILLVTALLTCVSTNSFAWREIVTPKFTDDSMPVTERAYSIVQAEDKSLVAWREVVTPRKFDDRMPATSNGIMRIVFV